MSNILLKKSGIYLSTNTVAAANAALSTSTVANRLALIAFDDHHRVGQINHWILPSSSSSSPPPPPPSTTTNSSSSTIRSNNKSTIVGAISLSSLSEKSTPNLQHQSTIESLKPFPSKEYWPEDKLLEEQESKNCYKSSTKSSSSSTTTTTALPFGCTGTNNSGGIGLLSSLFNNNTSICCNQQSGKLLPQFRQSSSTTAANIKHQQPTSRRHYSSTAIANSNHKNNNHSKTSSKLTTTSDHQQTFNNSIVLFNQRRGIRSTLDIEIDMQQLYGVDLLREPNVNKDLAFTTREREVYKLKGLLPAAIRPQELQVQVTMDNLRSINSDLGKYMFLRDLQDHNKRLFYRVLQVYTKELMPIVYTPIVGLACQKYSLIFKRPRGMFITINDAGRVFEILGNCGEPEIKAIVVTDGERILGLGDLGANGMGIPVGKMALYSAIAGIPPELTLPVTLDVGTNNQTLLDDPYYIGLKQKRATGLHYDQLVDEFMEAVVKRWGRSCLIQFEDFGNKNAFRLLKKYKKQYCTFNDDIQGTASVAVAGMVAAFRKTNTKIQQHKFLFLGAGEAALGIASLLVMAMVEAGMEEETAYSKIWLIDSQGLVTTTRGESDEHKKPFAKNAANTKDLLEIVNLVEPTCLIGVAAVPGAFNEQILKRMAELNKNPIIFALSNPTSKAECTAEQAYVNTDGRCVFASGSPFDNVTYNGKTFVPGQGNNAYIFPGVALAVMACQVHEICDEVFLVASTALAEQVSKSDLETGSVYPPLDHINEVSLRLAARVAEYLYAKGYANHRPEPDDKYLFLKSRLYDALYDGSDFSKHVEDSHLAWHQHHDSKTN